MEEMNYEERKAAFERKVDERIPVLSALQSLIIGNKLKDSEIEAIREFKSVQEYLDLPLNDPAENGLKKIVVTAVVTANQLGILKLPEGYNNAESIASIVDEGLTRIKTAYQVAKGILNPIDATEAINDRMAVRVASVVDVVVDKLEEKAKKLIDNLKEKAMPIADFVAEGVNRVSAVVCSYVERVFPPAKVVTSVIKRVVRFVSPVVRQTIAKGIAVVAETAKKVVTKVASAVKSFAKKAFAKLFG
jgi:hypothetical protein